MLYKLRTFYNSFNLVVDSRVKKILFFSILTGSILFLCEYAFIISLQGFLAALEITSSDKLNLPSYYPKELVICLFIFLAIGVARVFFQGLKVFCSNYASQFFGYIQREKILRLSLYFYPHTSTHEVMSLFTDTLNRASTAVMEINGLIVAVTTTAALVASGFTLAPKEMLVGFVLMMTLFIPLKMFSNSTHMTGYKINDVWKIINKELVEGMKHNFFIKIHGLLDNYNGRGQTNLNEYKRLYVKHFIFSGIRNSFPIVFGMAIICVISFLGKYYFHTDSGKLLVFLYLFIRCAQGASEVSASVNSVKVNYSGFLDLADLDTRLRELEKIENDKKDSITKYETINTLNQIEFRNVEFYFHQASPLLRNINFNLVKSNVLLIKGASGTGKSTIVSLLVGMLTPVKGAVLINGKEMNEVNLNNNFISYVGPEPFIFEDTIRNNLIIGNPYGQVSDDEILKVMKATSFDTVFNLGSKDLDFKLNETVQLSTGQKQRLSLTRALLRKPQLLILDESTANLDNETEELIFKNLKEYLPNLITIIIGHKSNFDNIATTILDLNSGNV